MPCLFCLLLTLIPIEVWTRSRLANRDGYHAIGLRRAVLLAVGRQLFEYD